MNEKDLKTKILIVGGGISGLSLAWELAKQSDDVMVVSPDFGGLLAQADDNGFRYDISGGHVYSANNLDVLGLMTNLDSRMHDRKAFYMHKGELVGYPVQDYADEIGIKLDLGPIPEYGGQSLIDFVQAVYGKQFIKEFFAPFNLRVWTHSPNFMDSDWIASRVKLPTERKDGWGPNSRFLYAPGQQMFDFLKRRVQNKVKLINDKVLYPDLGSKTVQTLGGKVISYETLVWTPSIKFLAPQIDMDPTTFNTNRVMTVCVGLNRMFDELDFHWYYPQVYESRVHRVTKLSRYHSTLAPEGCDSFMLEMPYRHVPFKIADGISDEEWKWEPIGPWMKKAQINPAIAEWMFHNAGITTVKNSDIVSSIVTDVPGYPIPTIGIRNYVATAKQKLLGNRVITAGRFGSHAYFNIEHCIEEARIIASMIEQNYPKLGSNEGIVNDYLYSTHYYPVYKK